MEFIPTELPEVFLIKPKMFKDERGFFFETFRKDRFDESSIKFDFVQDNHSGSKKGVLRGLHYQIQQAQGKLVRVVSGEIFDVAVDIRRSSPNFGKWAGEVLSSDNHHQLWVPPGFAHGFYVLSDWAEVTYKTTDYYAPQWDRTILWNDPVIRIEWPVASGDTPSVSQKDADGKLLKDADTFE